MVRSAIKRSLVMIVRLNSSLQTCHGLLQYSQAQFCCQTIDHADSMADIFISYANEDRKIAEQIATVLGTAGFTVWWDRRIPAGRSWRSVLEEALQGMRCLVVLWSENSILSPWVIEEAEEARRLNKIMFPVLIHKIDPPVGFRAIQAANLS